MANAIAQQSNILENPKTSRSTFFSLEIFNFVKNLNFISWPSPCKEKLIFKLSFTRLNARIDA
jgi:hypothetical protein